MLDGAPTINVVLFQGPVDKAAMGRHYVVSVFVNK